MSRCSRRSPLAALTAALALSLTAACGAAASVDTAGGAGTPLPSHRLDTSGDTPGAAYDGRLVVQRGCVSLADQDVVLLWPAGTRLVQGDPASIVDGDGTILAVAGDNVTLGGASPEAYKSKDVVDVSPPSECGAGPGFLIFTVDRT